MRLLNNGKSHTCKHCQTCKKSINQPKRGQIWTPKDPAHNAVIVATATADRVYLQYATALDVSFAMDLRVFLKHYQYSHHAKGVQREHFETTEPFFA